MNIPSIRDTCLCIHKQDRGEKRRHEGDRLHSAECAAFAMSVNVMNRQLQCQIGQVSLSFAVFSQYEVKSKHSHTHAPKYRSQLALANSHRKFVYFIYSFFAVIVVYVVVVTHSFVRLFALECSLAHSLVHLLACTFKSNRLRTPTTDLFTHLFICLCASDLHTGYCVC